MPILRDVVARLGMDFDGRGFKKAENRIGGLKSGLGGLGVAIAGITAALGSLKLLRLGSDAQETLNVMNFAFEESTKKVQEWSREFGNAAGRSEFELQKTASTLGAVLNPMMEKNSEAAAEMSMNLAQLSVDLGSFFDRADEDVLVALRSGLVGEMEPMRRFGVVMTQDALAAFAMANGMKANIKEMSISEKATLRYNFIMDQTSLAQGDAVRTAKNWANATKALKGALHEVGTNIGLVMLPKAEKLLNWTVEIARGFSNLVKNSKFVEAVFVSIGIAAVLLAGKINVAFKMVHLKFLLIGAAIFAAFLIIEDFINFLDGNKSAIGEFIDMIAGPGSAEQAALTLKDAFAGLNAFMEDQVMPGLSGLGDAFSWVGTQIADTASEIWNSIVEFVSPAIDKIKEFIGWVEEGARQVFGFLGLDYDRSKEDAKKMMEFGFDSVGDAAGEIGGAFSDAFERTGFVQEVKYMFGEGAEQSNVAKFRSEDDAIIRENIRQGIATGTTRSRELVQETARTLNVNITGLSEEQMARKVAKEIKRQEKISNKKASKALTQGAE
jgi:hypothetical protein